MPNQLSPKTIKMVFESFDRSHKAGWKFPSKTKLYRDAASSLAGDGNAEKFGTSVYPKLEKDWSVRRSPLRDSLLPAPQTFSLLMSVKKDFPRFEASHLRDFNEQQILDLATILQRMAVVKKNKREPSVMAISKFLHFWNPRFFVIYDQAVVRGWLFKHHWLESPRDEFARTVRAHLANSHAALPKILSEYIAVLWTCAEWLCVNTRILDEFFDYCQQRVCNSDENPPLPERVNEFDAVAIEWFLLGAAHFSPKD